MWPPSLILENPYSVSRMMIVLRPDRPEKVESIIQEADPLLISLLDVLSHATRRVT